MTRGNQFICPNCEHVYDEEKGEPREGWPAGTAFADIDADWTCPDCGVREQVDFLPIEQFERNDQDGKITTVETRGKGKGNGNGGHGRGEDL
ncbi:MAG: rubredoxin [Dermatophilaceae bacterium]|nr:rubredoxin [Dermatophilaceae bacterium]